MPESQKPTVTRRLSEVEAHQLLARAAELDARLSTSVSADQLWSAALEAGISEEALAQATAELDAGKLLSPARGAAIRAVLGTFGKVAVAAVLIFALFVSPRYPLAQMVGLALAVYGAYDSSSRLVRWFGKWRRYAVRHHGEISSEHAEAPTDEHRSMSIRIFVVATSAHGAA